MKNILSTVGSCSITVLIFYIIKKIQDFLQSENEEDGNYKIDKEDDK